MKSYILPLLLTLFALVFGVIFITQSTAPKKPELASSEVVDANDVIGQQAKEIAALKAKLAEAELAAQASAVEPEPLKVVPEPAPEPRETVDDELASLSPAERERRQEQQRMQKIIGDIIGNFSRMSTNENAIARREEMGRMWRDQQRLESQRRVAEEYGDLLSKFDLTLEDRKDFLALLAKKRAASWGRRGNAEQREAAEAEIKAFLGEEGYAEYRNFEDTKYGRGKVAEISKVFGEGLAMSEEQSDKMVDLMGGMESFERDFRRAGWGGWIRGAAENATDMDQRLDELETRYNQILTDSSEVLDGRQVEALSTHFENNLQRAEQGVEMATQWQKNMESIISPENQAELRKMFEGGGLRLPQR